MICDPAGAATPRACRAEGFHLSAKLGEPVFVAAALVGESDLGVISFVLDTLPGRGQFSGHGGLRGPGLGRLLLRGLQCAARPVEILANPVEFATELGRFALGVGRFPSRLSWVTRDGFNT